ncbi:MAG: Gfo/Idh/MocA family oxidoreductase [Propionicimonas sp.]|uniref:Gfo/Idh/MocA family protein n=1 Tax=Propionicimonas sp. TaxID=1955623 RepID=UPI003D0CAD42
MTLPTPRAPFDGPVPALRWGVIGAGGIAGRFVDAVRAHTGQQVVAVAARSAERATAFATTHQVPRACTPAELLGDPAVDVVYVATPHNVHAEWAIAAAAAGKHVLVEKPIATSADEARTITAAARAAGVLVMEAMWTRYLPQFDILRHLLADGALGDVVGVAADFGFAAPYDPSSRMRSPDLAGGALLDAGVYPISFASAVLGPPSTVSAVGRKLTNGVDLYASAVLGAATGAAAHITTSIVAELPTRATVVGTTARLEFRRPFYAPTELVLTRRQDGRAVTETWTDDAFTDPYSGLSHEATALAGYVAEGRVESPVHPHEETIAVLATIEQVRAQLTVVDGP